MNLLVHLDRALLVGVLILRGAHLLQPCNVAEGQPITLPVIEGAIFLAHIAVHGDLLLGDLLALPKDRLFLLFLVRILMCLIVHSPHLIY